MSLTNKNNPRTIEGLATQPVHREKQPLPAVQSIFFFFNDLINIEISTYAIAIAQGIQIYNCPEYK